MSISDNRPDAAASSETTYGNDPNRKPLPPLLQRFRIGYILQFVEYWLISRFPSRMLMGLPAFAVALAALILIFQLRGAHDEDVVRRYDEAANEAIRNEDWQTAFLWLRSLSSLRPHVREYKFKQALLNEQVGRLDRAAGLMQQMAPLDAKGYAPARRWIVQANLTGKVRSLTRQELGRQLQLAVKENPYDDKAFVLLADYYVSEKEFSLAETALRSAAELKPEHFLALARLQKSQNRNEKLVNASLDSAISAFQAKLARNSNDHQSRVNWSVCLAMQNDFQQSEQILREGLARQDSPELRTALSTLYSDLAQRQLNESPLNAAKAGALLTEAIKLAPSNAVAIQRLSQLPEFPAAAGTELGGAVEFWNQQVAEEATPASLLVLGHLMQLSDQRAEAISVLEDHVVDAPALRPLLARLYIETDARKQADELFDELLSELRQMTDVTDEQRIVQQGVLLLQAQQYQQAVDLMLAARDQLELTDTTTFNSILCQNLVELAREQATAADDQSQQALAHLQQAIETDPGFPATLGLLAEISCSDAAAADEADQMLVRLLAQGSFNAQIYHAIGTKALQAEQFDKATRYLSTARQLDPQNPAVLNNLALATLRGPTPDPANSLQLAETVLELVPDNPDALSTRAEVLLAMERWQEADRDLQLALPSRPESRNVRRMLIQVNEQLGNDALADEHRRILNSLQ